MPRPSQYRCGYCGIPGHRREACHVSARGAREHDHHDERACELVSRTAEKGDLRRLVARELRDIERAAMSAFAAASDTPTARERLIDSWEREIRKRRAAATAFGEDA